MKTDTASASVNPDRARLPHIVLVEDQERAARGLAELLELEGFRVSVAPDGHSAIRIAERSAVSAFVLDIGLPDMSGFDLCRVFRSNPRTSGVPIVMLTGLSDTPSKIQGFNDGADDYLVKPIPARELAVRLRRLIQSRLEAADAVHRHRLQAIGEIAAAVSHEINNPLAAALGTLDLTLLRPDLNLDARRDLAGCRTQLWRIATTLAQLTHVQDRTVEYVGTDRMVELTPSVPA